MVVPHDHIISILDYSDEMMQDLIAAQMQLTRYLYAQWHVWIAWLMRDAQDPWTNWVLIGTKTWKSLAHLHMHCIPDCKVTAAHLAVPSASDNRHILTDEEFVEMKSEWEGVIELYWDVYKIGSIL